MSPRPPSVNEKFVEIQMSACRGRDHFNSKHSGWEIINEDELKDGDQHGSLANMDSSPGTSGHKMGHGSSSE